LRGFTKLRADVIGAQSFLFYSKMLSKKKIETLLERNGEKPPRMISVDISKMKLEPVKPEVKFGLVKRPSPYDRLLKMTFKSKKRKRKNR
jgi:hypothetical protein